MSALHLAAGDWRAAIDPRLGGCLLELTHAGRPVLRPATVSALQEVGVRATACYPLLPYANRIDHGRFRAAGREHRLRPNFPSGPHPLHGVGWRSPWREARVDARSVDLVLEHRPEAAGPQDWPFAFEARQRLELTDAALTIALSVRNLDAAAWPAGLGLHPNFVLRPGQSLQFEAAGVWCSGADQLPSHPETGADWSFCEPRPLDALELDHDFFGWRGRARLRGGEAGTVLIEAGKPFDVLRVFIARARGFVALEPASHIADAINRPDAKGGGYRLLEPGAVLAGTVTLSLEQGS